MDLLGIGYTLQIILGLNDTCPSMKLSRSLDNL